MISNFTNNLLSNSEDIEVEYKESILKSVKDTMVAMSNAKGGYILIGVEEVEDKAGKQIGKIKGIPLSDKNKISISNYAQSTLDKIEIEITTETDENYNSMYIVKVKEGKNKPYCTGGGRYLIRKDGNNTAITPTMMKQFFEEGDELIDLIDIDVKAIEDKLVKVFKQDNSIHEKHVVGKIFQQLIDHINENDYEKEELQNHLNNLFKEFLKRLFVVWEISIKYDKVEFMDMVIDKLVEIYTNPRQLIADNKSYPFGYSSILKCTIFTVIGMGAYAIYSDKPKFAKLLLKKVPESLLTETKHSWFRDIVHKKLITVGLCFNAFEFLSENKYILKCFDFNENLLQLYITQFDYYHCINSIEPNQSNPKCVPSFNMYDRNHFEPMIVKIIDSFGSMEWVNTNMPNVCADYIDRLDHHSDSYRTNYEYDQWQNQEIRKFIYKNIKKG